jgi:hypothetical protein
LTVGALANILVIHDKLIRLIGQENFRNRSIGTNVLLQSSQGESLNWSDATLTSFLTNIVPPKFGVSIAKKHIKTTINGSWSTVGDLSIAISTAIHRQHRSKKPGSEVKAFSVKS